MSPYPTVTTYRSTTLTVWKLPTVFLPYRSSTFLSSCRPTLRDVSPYPTVTTYRSSTFLSSCRPTLRDVSPYPTVTTYRSSTFLSSCRPVALPYVTCRPTLQSLPTGRVYIPVVLSSCRPTLRDVSPYPTVTTYRLTTLTVWKLPTVFLPYRSSTFLSSCRPVALPYVTCRPTLQSLPTGRVHSCRPVALPYSHYLQVEYIPVVLSSCRPTLHDVSPYPTVTTYRSSTFLSSCRPTLRDVSPYPTVTTYRSITFLSSCRPVALPYVTCRPTLQSLPTGRVHSCRPVVLSPYPT